MRSTTPKIDKTKEIKRIDTLKIMPRSTIQVTTMKSIREEKAKDYYSGQLVKQKLEPTDADIKIADNEKIVVIKFGGRKSCLYLQLKNPIDDFRNILITNTAQSSRQKSKTTTTTILVTTNISEPKTTAEPKTKAAFYSFDSEKKIQEGNVYYFCTRNPIQRSEIILFGFVLTGITLDQLSQYADTESLNKVMKEVVTYNQIQFFRTNQRNKIQEEKPEKIIVANKRKSYEDEGIQSKRNKKRQTKKKNINLSSEEENVQTSMLPNTDFSIENSTLQNNLPPIPLLQYYYDAGNGIYKAINATNMTIFHKAGGHHILMDNKKISIYTESEMIKLRDRNLSTSIARHSSSLFTSQSKEKSLVSKAEESLGDKTDYYEGGYSALSDIFKNKS